MDDTQEAEKKATTSTTTSEDTTTTTSKWVDPPPDLILAIADHLDRNIGLLRLRSVCKSWRLSLSYYPPSITFPVHLPLPPPPSSSSSNFSLTLLHRTTYLLTPLSPPPTTTTDVSTSFLIKLEQKPNHPNTFSLINTLSSYEECPCHIHAPVNLLDYKVIHVCDSYVFSNTSPVLFKKVVASRNFFEAGDFVVLGLKLNGTLLLWRNGDSGWTKIKAPHRRFDDIATLAGKFYAIADKKGRLVMIDKRLNPVDLVPKLMYGDGAFASLVECDGKLFVLDRKNEHVNEGVIFEVFKLDDKGRFWDYEPNLDGGVFFLGEDANFALSKRDYDGVVSDAIYFQDPKLGNGHINDGWPQVIDLNERNTLSVVDSKKFESLVSPPDSWIAIPIPMFP